MQSWNVSIETFHETFHDIRQGDCKFMRVKYSKIRMHAHVRMAGRLSMHACRCTHVSCPQPAGAVFVLSRAARKDTGGDGRQKTFPM